MSPITAALVLLAALTAGFAIVSASVLIMALLVAALLVCQLAAGPERPETE